MTSVVMLDSLDTQMLDLAEDTDVPMAGSHENWLSSGMLMDEDSHHANQDSQEVVEIDMASYDETTEYEMLDEPIQHDPVDAEVVDVSFHESPQPSHSTTTSTHEHQFDIHPAANSWIKNVDEQSSVVPDSSIDREFETGTPSSIAHRTTIIEPVSSTSSAQALQTDSTAGQTEALDTISQQPFEARDSHTTSEESPAEHIAEDDAQSKQSKELVPDRREESKAVEETVGISVYSETDPSTLPAEHDAITPELEQNREEASTAPVVDSTGDTSEEEIHFDPPPPIHLSLHIGLTEGVQPEFVLFNSPETSSSTAEEPLILLQHLPSLYYEPISTVFEAFRTEEYFSHLQELSEAEMSISAYDLQLIISEDNVYAREVSLHDLFAMHQGVGLPGHLRLSLQSIVPRFISRYNQLREQITNGTCGDTHIEGNASSSDRIGLLQSQEGQPQEGDGVLHDSEIVLNTDILDNQSPTSLHEDDGEISSSTGAVLTASAGSKDKDNSASINTDEANADANFSIDTVADEAELAAESGEHDDALHEQSELANKSDVDASENVAHREDEDNVEELDADALHISVEGRDEDGKEDAPTEYFDAASPADDDEAVYIDEPAVAGMEGSGTTSKEDPAKITVQDATSLNNESDDYDAVEEQVNAQTLSTSTSRDTSAGDLDTAVDAEYEEEYVEEQTDHSRHEEYDNLSEGNFEEDDIGDEDFGDEGLDSSEDGTLDGTSPTEDVNELTPNTSLPEDPLPPEESTLKISALIDGSDSHASDVKEVDSQDFTLIHKNGSKRSLDEVDVEEEESSLDSPGAKRSRVL